jgi:amino acid transporter
VAFAFISVLTAINFRGVAESVKFNVVLTCIEFSGLLIVIAVGFTRWATVVGDAANALEFNAGGDPFSLVISGATLAFFAHHRLRGLHQFRRGRKNPRRQFSPRFFIGITITGIVYMLVRVRDDGARADRRPARQRIRICSRWCGIGAAWFPLTCSRSSRCAPSRTPR